MEKTNKVTFTIFTFQLKFKSSGCCALLTISTIVGVKFTMFEANFTICKVNFSEIM